MEYLILLAIGLVAGVFSGMFGIGGGLIIVPALILLMKLKTLQATGTSLAALIPPVGLLGAYAYYKAGHINVVYAGLLALGLFVGAYFGANLVIGLPGPLVRKLYAAFLVIMGIRLFVGK